MIIWLALLVPVITAFVLFFFFRHKTAWWEFAIPFLASLLFIWIMKFTTELSLTSDTEYWGEPITQAIYSEPWDEEVPCRHPKYCTRYNSCKSRDSKGNCRGGYEEYQCGYKHAYDVDYHSEYWEVTTASGNSSNISQAEFNRYVNKWGNKSFVDKHRDYHSIDGDWYVSTCPNDDSKIECFVTSHSYENRVQASHSVFNYPDVEEKDVAFYGLYDYPSIYENYKQIGILGPGDSTKAIAENKIQILNAKLGPKKQVKVFVLVFKNKSDDVAYHQECYWKGGNKNEFVVCIGVDNAMNVTWCRPFSFTEVQEVKVETRNYVESMGKLNLSKVSDFLYTEIDQKFKRKHFRDFSYLTVEPKGWQVILTFILTVVINLGLSLWLIKNEYDEENPRGDGGGYRRYYKLKN